MIILLFLFGFGATSSQGILMGFFKELSSSSIEGTLLGCGNAFGFIGGALLQNISSGIVGTYGHFANAPYPRESIIVGLWVVTSVSLFVMCYSILFVSFN